MPRIKLSDELKSAVSQLSSKEKDKLLFRLLPKDQKLIHQLEFKLLENGETVEERREKIRAFILSSCEMYPKKYYSPNYLLLRLKDFSGKITYHTTITKDKIGEIELNLLMINEVIGRNIEQLKKEDKWDAKKLAEYVVVRIKKLHGLVGKLHEDYLLEFEDDIKTLREIMGKLPLFNLVAEENDIELSLIK